MTQEKDWYFTFGYGHDPGIGFYAVFHGTEAEAREKMFEAYGRRWAFQYGSAEEAGVVKYNLRRHNKS